MHYITLLEHMDPGLPILSLDTVDSSDMYFRLFYATLWLLYKQTYAQNLYKDQVVNILRIFVFETEILRS